MGEAIALKDFDAIKKAVEELTEIKLSSGIQVSEYITIKCEKGKDDEVPDILYSIKQESNLDPQFVDPKNARRKYYKLKLPISKMEAFLENSIL